MASLVVALLVVMPLLVVGEEKTATHNKFRKLGVGESLVGSTGGNIKTVSVVSCSEKCLLDHECKGYVFNKNQQLNCLLIKYNSTGQAARTLVSTKENVVYMKDHCYLIMCEHGGLCVALDNWFTCDCQPGFTGNFCQTNIDDCQANLCQNGGTCVDGINSFTCTCPTGWIGDHCEEVDDCVGDQCQNGGACVDGNNSYTCNCAPGFNGTNCESNIDECSGSPCQHGGICVDEINFHTCTCVHGFTGIYCETDIDDCLGNLCQNNGTCVDGINSFSCVCPTGFTGIYCETNIDDCLPVNPCQNGGTCADGANFYTCTCDSGYTGLDCNTDIDDCAGNPCQNNGTCVDGINSYTCTCAAGSFGDQCQEVDDCVGDPCQNGGTCTDGTNSFTCACSPGFNGATCQTNIDDCPGNNPCQNGGTCVDGINSYMCACSLYYGGSTCRLNCANPWCTITPWTLGNIPGKRFDFESTTGMTLKREASLSSGKVGQGISLDHTKKQWVDLGVLTAYSCLPSPETCGPDGATLTAWVNLINCPSSSAFISSFRSGKTAFATKCTSTQVSYLIYHTTGSYHAKGPKPVGWFHLTVQYLGAGKGIRVYYDGVRKGTDTSLYSQASHPSSGKMILGRFYIEFDNYYSTVQIDELTLWDN